MSDDASRRFTDKEVALVLRKASELEESEGPGGGGGLTLGELEQIATEVGIAPDRVRRAVQEMDTQEGEGFFAEAPKVHQIVRAVPGEVDGRGMALMVQHIDGNVDEIGVVTEALGNTQWTSQNRFRTLQVSIDSGEGETRVRVVERASQRLWTLSHAAPTMVAAALVAGSVGQFDPSSGAVAAFTALGAAVGAGVGRALWSRLAATSKARVQKLASILTREARELTVASEQGASGTSDTSDAPDTDG